MKKVFAFTLIALMFLVACGDKVAAEVAKTKAEVIAVHDEVMPKMTEIAGLQKKVKAKIVAMQVDTTNSDPVAMSKFMSSAMSVELNLASAEKSMNDWMVEFHDVTEQKVDAQKMLDAMKAEQTKINKVKVTMLSAIEEAKQFLKNE